MNRIVLKFPSDAKIVTIGEHWHRDEHGAIIATYKRGIPMFDDWTFDELEACMKILEESERCFLSRQKESDVEARAMARFGARSGDGF